MVDLPARNNRHATLIEQGYRKYLLLPIVKA
jgi:hypothetical protein